MAAAVGVFMICALTSCYVLPVKKIEGSFRGLESSAGRVAKAEKPATVRILMVQGMGVHTPHEWELPLVNGIAARMNLESASEPSSETFSRSGHVLGVLWLYPFAQRETGVPVRMYALTWSPTTTAWKDKKFATDLEYGRYRLVGDRLLKKELMDYRLSDAVLYAGQYRQHMQYPIMKAVSYILHDDFGPHDELAIITESLGSYMTYDTLLRMSRGYAILGERNYNPRSVNRLVGQTSTVYMLANQIPLLELTEANNPVSQKATGPTWATSAPPQLETAKPLMKQFADERTKRAPSPSAGVPFPLTLDLVAFSDPNDLLSYPIDKADVMAGGGGPRISPVQYSNVTYSLARWSLLWLIVDPLKAHTGHADSKAVIDLIVRGHNEP